MIINTVVRAKEPVSQEEADALNKTFHETNEQGYHIVTVMQGLSEWGIRYLLIFFEKEVTND